MATITLRLTIADPVPTVLYSLQDKDNALVDSRIATAAALSFDIPVTLNDDGRLTGTFVRREGKERRFVYLVMHGQPQSPVDDQGRAISRRAKIDIHDIPETLRQPGAVLGVTLPGRDRTGRLPACASVKPTQGWRAL